MQRWVAMSLLAIVVSSPGVAAGQSPKAPARFPTDRELVEIGKVVQAAHAGYPKAETALLWAIMWTESKYDRFALGTSGEVGLGQLMPRTARNLKVRDRTNIQESVFAVAKFVSHLEERYHGNLRLVLAAYTDGETRVNQCRCVPPGKAKRYVRNIETERYPFAKGIVAYLDQLASANDDKGHKEADLLRTQLEEKDETIRTLRAAVESQQNQINRLKGQAKRGVPITEEQAVALVQSQATIDELQTQMQAMSAKSADRDKEIASLREAMKKLLEQGHGPTVGGTNQGVPQSEKDQGTTPGAKPFADQHANKIVVPLQAEATTLARARVIEPTGDPVPLYQDKDWLPNDLWFYVQRVELRADRTVVTVAVRCGWEDVLYPVNRCWAANTQEFSTREVILLTQSGTSYKLLENPPTKEIGFAKRFVPDIDKHQGRHFQGVGICSKDQGGTSACAIRTGDVYKFTLTFPPLAPDDDPVLLRIWAGGDCEYNHEYKFRN